MGEVFAGRYELVDPVATGGMGAIWRVLDRQDGQLKAAKILRQSDAGSLLRFVREQSMRIDHPHVVTPQSWAGMDDRVLFTMPLVGGGSVADLVREHGPLPWWWVAVVTDQLLDALEAVHAAGIVHRDVKPGNLLLEPTGHGRPHLRLTDFGIAAPVDEPRMTRGVQAIGTPTYMPPEQWHGADPHPTLDVYAVGRVVHEMLLGRRPADEDDPSAAVTGPAGAPGDRLLGLVSLLTRPDPAERPQTATEARGLLAGLVAAAEPQPGDAPVVVPDRFPQETLPDSPRGPAPGFPPPPPTPPPPPGRGTRGTQVLAADPAAPPTAARPSALPGVALVVLGLVGLVVATWLLLG
ncbi:serine/threonine-protein kinase [Nocardioides litoris]|uniref:serine/threonine-protein kinase n=1 Tax=Nocardioides litoris TaxID=1926648 RepID=UPI00111D5C09|nr:serine/threonine-protein kinase [Nocardioides litoris]